MGSGRWSASDWDTVSTARSTMSASAIFTTTGGIDPELDPLKFKIRESCDSAANPHSTPIILASDVTGSMGSLAEMIAKNELGKVMKELYDRIPVPDPHIAIMAIGDTYFDHGPCQMTQFEADIRLSDQLAKIWIESGGGGNMGESYMLPWYMAAYRTKCDAFIKRKKKGYIFTVGDEPMLPALPKDHIKRFLGDDVQSDLQTRDLLTIVQENWHVFHLIVKPVRNAVEVWKDLLGQNAMMLTDHTKMGEVIVSTMQVMEGEDATKVAKSWSGDTSVVVATAVKDLVASKGSKSGIVRL